MDNPFVFSGIVTGKKFCNRAREQDDLINYINASQNVLLFSNRRTGKTSLLHQVFSRLGKDIGRMYVDLYGTVTEQDFILSVMKNIGQLESRIDRLIKITREIFTSANISLSVDPVTGLPSLSPVFTAKSKNLMLDNVMALLDTYSKKKKTVVVLDEFQEIENYSKGDFEKKLRSIIQHHNNISYIFAGSKQHILDRMFHSTGKAFYRLAESYPLPEIDEISYLKWIRGNFGTKNTIPDSMILDIITICEKHPMYIQQFCYHLWEKKPSSGDVITEILSLIISRNENEFMSLWDNLTSNQRKALKLIAVNQGVDLYSAGSLSSVGFTSPSQVTKSIEALMTKEIISKNGKYVIQDVMFKQWLLRL